MDEDIVSAVREDEATALSRLGSDKYLIAVTAADLQTGPVLRSVAAECASAATTFDRWAGAEDGDVAEAFAAAADAERDHRERVSAALPDGEDTDDATDPVADAVDAALGASEGTVERVAAGLVGRPLVVDRALLQVVSFFVNEADATRADLARDLRADVEEQLDDGAALLAEICEDEDDRERARRVAGRVVADAYDAYANALEEMGVDPKPVC